MQAKERTFKHLTKNDRLRMERWLNKGMKPREIADKLRVHISTVYRELKRGEYERLDGDTWEMVTAYSPDIAEEPSPAPTSLPLEAKNDICKQNPLGIIPFFSVLF